MNDQTTFFNVKMPTFYVHNYISTVLNIFSDNFGSLPTVSCTSSQLGECDQSIMSLIFAYYSLQYTCLPTGSIYMCHTAP